MAIRSGFFMSVDGDRVYKSDFFAEYFATFIGNGVFPKPSDNLQVIANNDMTITVGKGSGWINGYVIFNDSNYLLNLEPADGVLNRIDRVVLRWDSLDREIKILVKKGEFASSPVARGLQRDADAYELALADVYVGKGVVSVTQSDVTDLRLNDELCGIVHGVVEQVDTTTLFNQYQSWINQEKQRFENDVDDWLANEQLDFETWEQQQKDDFDIWFSNIQDILDGNVAANLQSQIEQLQTDLGNIDAPSTQEFESLQSDFSEHQVDKANPHSTNKTHVGLGNVDNVKQASKVEHDQLATDFSAHQAEEVSQGELHGLRVNNEKLEYYTGVEWKIASGGIPVGNVSGLSIKEDNAEITLMWADPDDRYLDDIKIAEWQGTKIARKEGSYPVSDDDGVLVVDNTTRNQYSGNGYKDTGLTNDETYYYMAFPYTEDAITVDGANRVAGTPTEIDPDSWSGIQKIVRKGIASEHFTVGDQIMANYDGVETVFEIIGIDVETPTDSQYTHSMTLQTKDCLHNIQFDSKEPSNSDSSRSKYGNNRYIHSAVKQWLNSDEPKFNWKSQHADDAKPDDSLDIYNGAGFLNRLDPELAAVLGAVDKKVAKANVDGGGQDTYSDKVFLPTRVEVGLGTEGDTTGEVVYPFYDGVANAARIKNLDGSPRYWWLSSPSVDYSTNVCTVDTDGSIGNRTVRNPYGVSPACVII